MSDMSSPFVLIIGSSVFESVQSRLVATGYRYVQKRLDSSPKNWASILELLKDPDLKGVVATFTGWTYHRFFEEAYRALGNELMESLAKANALVLVHEDVLQGRFDPFEMSREDDDFEDVFYAVDDSLRQDMQSLAKQYELEFTPYRRNAEASLLASSYVNDRQSNLLFRVYVPKGRLYAEELARMIDLFYDWLTSVKRKPVRRGGYQTTYGEFVEFFSDEDQDLSGELAVFSDFLGRIEDAPTAEAMLISAGVARRDAPELVSRYVIRLRRLQADMKHAFERSVLAVRQELESELIDSASMEVPVSVIDSIVQHLVPAPATSNLASLTIADRRSLAPPSVTINQQFIEKVEGIVASNISGSIHLSEASEQLIQIIHRLGDGDASGLTAAVYELEDPAAPPARRLAARQKLKGFLAHAGGQVEKVAVGVIQAYLESVLRL